MVHRYATFIKAINLSVDYVILNVSMVVAYLIVDQSYVLWMFNKTYMPVVLVFNLVWLLSANITGLYEQVLNKDSVKTYQAVFKTYLLFLSLICFSILVIIGPKSYFITREYLFYALALFGFLLGIWKLIFLGIRKSDRYLLLNARNVIIVGADRIGHDLYRFFKRNPDRGYNVLGFFDDEPGKISDQNLYLGGTADCISYVMLNEVDEIFCALPLSASHTIDALMRDADKNLIRFKIIPEYYNHSKRSITVQNFYHIPVLSHRPEPL